MSPLIKHGAPATSQHNVRAFSAPAPLLAEAPLTRAPLSLAEQEALENQLADLRQEFEALQERYHSDIADARQAAYEAARDEIQKKEAERLSVLRTAMTKAGEDWRLKLEQTEILALALSHTAIDRLLSDPEKKLALIESAIARQIEDLRRASIVQILVSPRDYSEDGLRRLSSAFGKDLKFSFDPALQSAACRIELRLGQIELSLDQHREALDQLWRRLAGEAAP